MLTVKEFSSKYNILGVTIRKAIRSGAIPSIVDGDKIKIDPTDQKVKSWLVSYKPKPRINVKPSYKVVVVDMATDKPVDWLKINKTFVDVEEAFKVSKFFNMGNCYLTILQKDGDKWIDSGITKVDNVRFDK